MSPDLGERFPDPESRPPGRAAFEDAYQALGDEATASQLTHNMIRAQYRLAGGFWVAVACGYIDNFDTEERQFLDAEVVHHTGTFSLNEFTAPGGVEAFLEGPPSTHRIFRRGLEPEGDLSDEDFDLAMRNLQEELPSATVAWIHEALRIIQLPAEHSSGRARIERIMELAEATPGVPLELTTLVTMSGIRVVGGLALEAFWRSSNQAVLERNGYSAEYLTERRIKLSRVADDGKSIYIRDAYGNETVAAETADPAEREVLNAIGYDTHSVNGWRMWDQDLARIGLTPPPDSAPQDFARRIQDTLNAPRLGEDDRYIQLDDGTIKVRQPDGTIY